MTVTAAGVRIITQVPVPPTSQLVVTAAAASAATATTQAGVSTAQAVISTAQAAIATAQAAAATTTVGASSNIQILNWAYVQSFAVISATRNANNVITTASIVWPDGATGTFTTDTINTTFNAIDAWHATHILDAVTKTVTQTAVTRNASGAVTAQPAITLA